MEVFNDIDDAIVNLFRIVRDPASAEELQALVELTPFGRTEFVRCITKTDKQLSDVEKARRFLMRSFGAFATLAKPRNKLFDGMFSSVGRNPRFRWSTLPETIQLTMHRLQGVLIECRPYEDVIKRYDSPETLFYVDPPYLLSESGERAEEIYDNMFTEEQHIELIERLQELQGAVMLSGYPSPIYDDRLTDWQRFTRTSWNKHHKQRTDVLWCRDGKKTTKQLHFVI